MSSDDKNAFKIITIGDGGCGKTSIINKYTKNTFQHEYKFTIGMDFSTKKVDVRLRNGETIEAKLRIWDIGGQQEFKRICSVFYKNTEGALLLFDLTNRESFESTKTWYEELNEHVGKIPVVLVGNKLDLESHRVIEKSEAVTHANNLEISYFETSAKTGHDVIRLFSFLAKMMVDKNMDPKKRIELRRI